MQITLDLSSIPLFFVLFYVVFPVAVRVLRGEFWGKIYIIFSSMVGAMIMYSTPIGFVQMILPGFIPDETKIYIGKLFNFVAGGIGYLLAAIGFFLLFIFQHGLIKLISYTGWIETD
jgi:hypothetical protein